MDTTEVKTTKQERKLAELIIDAQEEAVKPMENLNVDFLHRFEYDAERIWKAQRRVNLLIGAQHSLTSKEEMEKYKAQLEKALLEGRISQCSTSPLHNLTHTWELECFQWMRSELQKILKNWEKWNDFDH
jgi:hypothetical protein